MVINKSINGSANNYPKDWKELNLGTSSILKARIGWQGLTTAEYLESGDYCLVTGTDFKDGYIDWDNCVFVEKLRYDQDKNIQLKENDVVVTKDGTIGKVAFIDKITKPTTLNSGVFVIRPQKKDYDSKYFYNVLMSEHFTDFLSKLTAGSTISHLYQKDFVHYNFYVPPTLTEQKAIATALSDVDNLISNLEKLIAKKKAMKQGAMQQLLTGKKRLPGFEQKKGFQQSEFGEIPKDWIESTFGEVLSGFSSGMTPYRGRPEYYRGDIRWITSGELNYNVITDTIEKITKDAVINTNLKILPKGTFLMAITGLEAAGTRGSCAIVGAESTTNQSCMALFSTKLMTTDYLYHFYLRYGDEFALKYCQGTKQQSYTAKIVKILPVIIPPTIEEQKAIATILSDMDKEIQALENKKAKCQKIKQGMMQELLTGKTRLV